jgi:hypothetical protein
VPPQSLDSIADRWTFTTPAPDIRLNLHSVDDCATSWQDLMQKIWDQGLDAGVESGLIFSKEKVSLRSFRDWDLVTRINWFFSLTQTFYLCTNATNLDLLANLVLCG